MGVLVEHWVSQVNKRAKKLFEERTLTGDFHPEFVARFIAANEEMDENDNLDLDGKLHLLQECLPLLDEEEKQKLAEAIRPRIPYILAHIALKSSIGQQG